MNSVNLRFVEKDIRSAEMVFGSTNVFWDENLNWLMIKNFLLPKSYNQPTTNCLIILPPGYGLGTKLEEFYLNAGLKVKRNKAYVDLPHYYQSNVHNGRSYLDKKWQWLCINTSWDQNDNLLTFLKQIELFLKFPFEEKALI